MENQEGSRNVVSDSFQVSPAFFFLCQLKKRKKGIPTKQIMLRRAQLKYSAHCRPFVLFGMDTHGTTRVVGKFDTHEEAIARHDELTEQVHKQHFWIVQESQLSPTVVGENVQTPDDVSMKQ